MTNRHLLIVEDHPLQQRVYQSLATKFDFSLRLASSCCEAVEAMEAQPHYSLILMDMSLADVDGCECTRRLRELDARHGQHTPIVAVTGHTVDEYKTMCMEAGMDDFLAKPFSIQQFEDLLERWAGSASDPA